MDAILSGQAGTLVFLEGAEARVVRLSDDSEFMIAREGVNYLFQGCNDVVVARRVSEQAARSQLEAAWVSDRALRMLLIALDMEEDSELRDEAADALEELLIDSAAKIYVENQLYSRRLPDEADPQFLKKADRWPATTELIQNLIIRQDSVILHRQTWDELSDELFDEGKARFEEEAINRGAFRMLASLDAEARDPNIAILECHNALRTLPNSRQIVTEWTKGFRRPGIRHEIVPDDVENDDQVALVEHVSSFAEYQSAIQQQQVIIDKMRAGSVKLARRYTDELIESQLRKNDPSFAAKSLCSLAQQAKALGLFSLQLEWAERAVRIAPSDAWAHGQAADALIQYFRLEEALAELDLSEAYGDPSFAATGRARVLRHQGRLDEALLAFRSAQANFPDEPFAWSGSAETLRDMWKLEEALLEYREAIRRFPNELFLKCSEAAVLSDLGRLDEALRAYSASQLKDEAIAFNGKATVLRSMGRFSEALETVQDAIELYPTDPALRCSQAEIYRALGDPLSALGLYDDIKKSSPNMSVSYTGYAEALRDMRRYPEAIAAYEEALSRFPSDDYVANGYANIHKVNDNLDEALRLYEGNVRRFPYSLVAKTGRADLLKRLGKYDDALTAYDEIIRIAPTFAAARNGKAAILVVRGEHAAALSLLPMNNPSTRDDWIAWNIRGMALVKSGELARGIEHLEEGRRQTPFARERRYLERALSVATMQTGDFNHAVDVLKEVGGLGLSNILRLHAYAGDGQLIEAKTTYEMLSATCPSELHDLRDAIAARFGLIESDQQHANDNWIFGRETEALLQAA